MKTAKFISLLIGISLSSKAQSTYQNVYYNSNAIESNLVCRSPQNGCLVAGIDLSGSLLMRLNGSGALLWQKSYGTNLGFQVLAPNYDTTYFVAGTMGSDAFIMKLNDHGAIIWLKKLQFNGYQNPVPLNIALTRDSGLAVCGQASATSGKNGFVSSFSKNGNLNWSRVYATLSNTTVLSSIKQTADTGFVALGTLNTSACIFRLSKTGICSWVKKYTPPSGSSYGSEIIVRGNNSYSYILAGSYPVIMLADNAGNVLSAKQFSKQFDLFSVLGPSYRMGTATDKGLYFMGNFMKIYPSSSGMIKCDSSLNFEWSSMTPMDEIISTQVNDKGYILLGTGPVYGFRSTSGSQIAVSKLDSMGIGNCVQHPSCSSSNFSITSSTITSLDSIAGSSSSMTLAPDPVSMLLKPGCVDFVGGVGENHETNNISIYPNPSSGDFTLKLSGLTNGEIRYSIENLVGETVNAGRIENAVGEHKINCRSLPPSVYFLKVYDKTGFLEMERMIITERK